MHFAKTRLDHIKTECGDAVSNSCKKQPAWISRHQCLESTEIAELDEDEESPLSNNGKKGEKLASSGAELGHSNVETITETGDIDSEDRTFGRFKLKEAGREYRGYGHATAAASGCSRTRLCGRRREAP